MKRKIHDLAAVPPRNTLSPSAPTPRPRSFPHDASIALVGLRGVGKSTIGVIASSILRRRLIDADSHFVTTTGLAAAHYASAHSWPAYRNREATLLAELLHDNPTGAVIVLSAGCVEKSASRALLRTWMETHPVIHIVRHEDEVEAYLRAAGAGVVHKLAVRRDPMYRACSNYCFYNMWDKRVDAGPGPSAPTLKRVEQDFLRLLNWVFGTVMAPLVDSGDAVGVPIEKRGWTYAVVLPPCAGVGVGAEEVDLEEVGSTAEAWDFRVDWALAGIKDDGFNRGRWASEQFTSVRRRSNRPIIWHVGTVLQGGSLDARPGAQGEEEYWALLLTGLRLGAEYLVVELQWSDLRIRELIAARGATKIIGAHFEARVGKEWGWDGAERRREYERAKELGCDIVWLSQKAGSLGDNFAAMAYAWDVEKRRDEAPAGETIPPLIAVNTGTLGKMSRCMNRVLSPVTHPLLQGYRRKQGIPDSSEDAEITAKEALIAIHAASILPPLKFCVFGSAIAHSLSPAMYNAAYAAYGVPHKYTVQHANSINELLHIVQDPSFGGASITLPFKLEIIPLLHSISDHARAIGAVNTIRPVRSGAGAQAALHGDNTDWIGIRTCTLRYLTPVNAITARTCGLVLGAGGMARAAVYALQKIGVENIFIWGRSINRAEELAEYFNARGGRCGVRVLPGRESPWPREYWLPSIVVSCIPAHSIQGLPPANITLPAEWLGSPTGGVCVELAYKPRLTPLLRQIRALAHKGWIGVDGLEVLPEQGFAQFEMFTGRQAPKKAMRDAVENTYMVSHAARAGPPAAGEMEKGGRAGS